MPPTITATYAALIAFFFVAMSFYVIITRAKTDVLVGDGGNINMLVAMRRHGNMAEYVPLALIMMGLAEALGLGSLWLHICGVALIGGRLLHPLGVTAEKSSLAPRVVGVLATMATILIPAIFILITTLL